MRTTIDILSVLKPIWRGFLAAVILTVLIAQAPAGMAGNLVPWFGIIDGIISDPDEYGVFHSVATEISNHGGKGTQESDFTIQPELEYRNGDVNGEGAGIYAIAIGNTTATTANDDVIENTFVLAERMTDAEGTPLNPPLACEGIYTVTGGTGRFADASGEGRLWGYVMEDGRVVLFFDGTISTPGSNRQKSGGPK